MLLDEEEEQDLKERQQKFLRTKRVKRGPKTSHHNINDDTHMIDTNTTSQKKQTPVKVLE